MSICPTPKKSRFATLRAAQSAADRAQIALGKVLYPYDECPCGWIHLTSKDGHVRRDPVLHLEPVDDVMFALVVRDEVMNKCAVSDAKLLRTPEYLLRWSDALKAFQIDLAHQLATRKGLTDKETVLWRKRISRMQKLLSDRRAEVKRLLYEHYTVRAQAKPRVHSVDAPTKEKRRIAGERAVTRLKDAHSEEFKQYLAEEYAAAGLKPIGDIPVLETKEKEE